MPGIIAGGGTGRDPGDAESVDGAPWSNKAIWRRSTLLKKLHLGATLQISGSRLPKFEFHHLRIPNVSNPSELPTSVGTDLRYGIALPVTARCDGPKRNV